MRATLDYCSFLEALNGGCWAMLHGFWPFGMPCHEVGWLDQG
jgi:hypothetical protein